MDTDPEVQIGGTAILQVDEVGDHLVLAQGELEVDHVLAVPTAGGHHGLLHSHAQSMTITTLDPAVALEPLAYRRRVDVETAQQFDGLVELGHRRIMTRLVVDLVWDNPIVNLLRDLRRVVRETVGFRSALLGQLTGIREAVTRLEHALERIMADLSALTAEVKENTDVTQSAVTLLNGLAARVQELADELAAAGTDASAVQALADELNASTDSLTAAVTANTPAETPPELTPDNG